MTVASMTCPSCGSEIRQGMLRCRECGRGSVNSTDEARKSVSNVSPVSALASKAVRDEKEPLPKRKPHTRSGGPARQTQQKQQPQGFMPTPATEKIVAAPVPRQEHTVSSSRLLVGGAILLALSISALVLVAAKNKSLPVWNSVGSVTMSADRVAAIWTVKHFGVVTLLTESGGEGKFVAAEHLPAEPFQVTGINLYDQTYDAGELAFLKDLSGLRVLDLSGTGITDNDMQLLVQAPKLESLFLRRCKITEAGYRRLPDNFPLEYFSASGSKVFNDESLKIISKKLPQLRVLLCTATGVTDEGLKELEFMTSLRDLRIEKTKTTDAAVAQLQEKLPKCRIRR